MASEDIRNIRRLQWTYLKPERHAEISAEENLVISNGENVEVQEEEVVVASDSYGVQSGDISTSRYRHEVVMTIEELQEEIPMVEIPEELLINLKTEGRRHFHKRGRYGAQYYHTMEPTEQPQMDNYYTDDEDYDPRYDDDGSGRSSYSPRNRRQPKRREFAHRLQWRNKDMLEAMCSVEEKKMTIRGASKKFGVPYSTLKDRIHGRVRHGTKPGVKTVLSPEEEEELVNYIRDMETAGFQVKHMDIRDRAGELLRLNHGLQSPYKDCSPGHNWLAGFIKRHPGLEFKRQNARNGALSVTKQKLLLRKVFDVAGQVFKKGKLYNRPDSVFALADIKFQLTVHGTYFPKATVFLCAAANGAVLPPFVVFRGHLKRLNDAREAYPDAFFVCSYQGGSDPDIFHWWLRDFFLKRIPRGTSHVTALYMCRPVGDVTLQVVQLVKEERVSLVALPSGTEHLLQALDSEICSAFRNAFVKRVEQWEAENPGVPFTQKAFAALLQKVWRKCFVPDDIVQKFAANGLFPLNPAAISAERIVASASMAVPSGDEDGDEPSPPEHAHVGSDTEEPMSGLNLLSALSTHEFASLENTADRDRIYAVRAQAGEMGHQERRGVALTMQQRTLGRRPMVYGNQNGDEESEARFVSPQQGPRGYRTTHETSHQQQQQRQNWTRPSLTLVNRLTAANMNVRNEIAAARQSEEQITRAIDSILDCELETRGQSQQGSIGASPGGAVFTSMGDAAGRPSRNITPSTRLQQCQPLLSAPVHPPPVIVSPAEVGAASKTVKIIKVKVEKGTNLQELAKELTRKIKEERDKQQAPRQQRAPLTAASSLKVIKTIAFPGMISAETLNTDVSNLNVVHHGYGGQVIEERVDDGTVVEGADEGEVVEEQVVEMEEDNQQLQQLQQGDGAAPGVISMPGLDLSSLQPGQHVVLEDGHEYVVQLLQGEGHAPVNGAEDNGEVE